MRCKTCSEEIVSADFVKCNGICMSTFHSKCVSLSKTLLNALGANPNIRWYCHDCNSRDSITASMTEVKESVGLMTTSLSHDLGQFLKSMSDMTTCVMNSLSSIAMRPPGTVVTPNNLTTTSVSHVHTASLPAPGAFTVGLSSRPSLKRRKGQSSQSNPNKIHCSDDRSSVNKPASASCPSDSVNKSIVVSNVSPDTDAHLLTTFLCSKLKADVDQVKVVSIVPKSISPEDVKFMQFRVSIPSALYDSVMHPSFWPPGVKVRDFVLRQTNRIRRPRPLPVSRNNFVVSGDDVHSPQLIAREQMDIDVAPNGDNSTDRPLPDNIVSPLLVPVSHPVDFTDVPLQNQTD